jgi:hypothetical protein
MRETDTNELKIDMAYTKVKGDSSKRSDDVLTKIFDESPGPTEGLILSV